MNRSLTRRSLTAVAAAALLAACSHGGARSLPPALPGGNSGPGAAQTQRLPQAAGVFPLRQARAAAVKNRTALSTTPAASGCGTVVTKHFGTLTYKVRGTKFRNTTVDANGCDVGIFIGKGDGEDDTGARVASALVINAGFAQVLVTDGVDDVRIHDSTIGTGFAGIAIDDATNVHVLRNDIQDYAAYGFVAEGGASYVVRQTTATGRGPGTIGAQAGFLIAGATQLDNANNTSRKHKGTGTTPAFLIPAGSATAQSYGFFMCAVTDANGRPLAAAGTNLVTKNDTNGIALAAACPSTDTVSGGKLYVANQSNSTVSVFDGKSHALLSVISDPSFHDTQEVGWSAGRLYVANFDRNTVSVLDTTNNYALLQTIAGNGLNGPAGITVDGGKLYVANALGNTISVFDVRNGYAPLPAIADANLNQPLGLAVFGGKLYVANSAFAASNVLLFDVTRANAYAGKITHPTLSIPTRVAFDGNGKLFVTTRDNGVDEFDTRNNNALVQEIGGEPITGPLGMTFGNNTLYVANAYDQSINTFDTTNNFLFHTFTDPSLHGAFGMAFEPPVTDPLPTTTPVPTATPTPAPSATPAPTPLPTATPAPSVVLYMTNDNTNGVDVDDPSTGALVGAIADPSMHVPEGIALSGGRLYVANTDASTASNNTISVFDTTNKNALVTVISGNNMFNANGLAAGNGKLFVPNNANSTVSVFDAANGYAPLPPIVDSSVNQPAGAAYANGKLYVVSFAPSNGTPRPPPQTNNISVFDTTNGNALVAVIPGPETQDGIQGAAVGNGFLFVTGAWSNKVYVFDVNTNVLVQTITDPSLSTPIEVAYARGRLYVSNQSGNGGVSVFDAVNNYAFVTVLPTRYNGHIVVADPSVPPTR
jgi:DNA-binding beta-propeller fold protein YncE